MPNAGHLAFNNQVTMDVGRLKFSDPAVIIRRADMHDIRAHMLPPDPDGKSGMLFYFYHHLGS